MKHDINNNVNDLIEAMSRSINASNDSQLCKYLDIYPSNIIKWRRSGRVPKKYAEKCLKESIDRKNALQVLEAIPVTNTEIAMELGIEPLSVGRMKKKDKQKFYLISMGVKMMKVIGSDNNKLKRLIEDYTREEN